jgi:hypothetical protein
MPVTQKSENNPVELDKFQAAHETPTGMPAEIKAQGVETYFFFFLTTFFAFLTTFFFALAISHHPLFVYL